MPLSDYEQRLLKQIEIDLQADPQFVSIVRSKSLRALLLRRRLQGAAVFIIGLALMIAGPAVRAATIGSFPVLCVIGFVLMYAGAVLAICLPHIRSAGRP